MTFGIQMGALPIALISALTNRGIKGFNITNSSLLLALGVITVLNLSADASLTYALSFGKLGIVSVLASLDPVVTSLFARFVSAERLSQLQMLGSGPILLGTLIVVSES